MPMLTGYGNDEPEMVDNPTEERQEPSNAGPMPSGGRTGADVIAGCMNQPSVCTPSQPAVGAGTTGPQADMSYGADAGYGM